MAHDSAASSRGAHDAHDDAATSIAAAPAPASAEATETARPVTTLRPVPVVPSQVSGRPVQMADTDDDSGKPGEGKGSGEGLLGLVTEQEPGGQRSERHQENGQQISSRRPPERLGRRAEFLAADVLRSAATSHSSADR